LLSIRRSSSAFLFFCLLSFTLSAVAADSKQSLAGPWRYLPYSGEGNFAGANVDDSAWPTMELPSNWFLLGSKEYPKNAKSRASELAVGDSGALAKIDSSQGLDYGGTVWFRRNVDFSGDRIRPQILELDMVDYYAEVFINGHSVAHHEGYFQRWSVDISKSLKAGQNLIALKISAPPMAFDMAQQYPISWPKNQNQIKGIFAYHDTRPGGTSYRGQERSTGGLLRGIALRQSSGLDLVSIHVEPREVSDASARLLITATVHNWTNKPQPFSIAGEITPANFIPQTSVPVALKGIATAGEKTFSTEVRVEHPALWWSWDYGKPNLYQINTQLKIGAVEQDKNESRFGIRSISHDANWVWHLNGRRIYPRGSNYIATQWLSQADKQWYSRDVQMMKDANLNSIRVHAHLERPEFYDAADEIGVMVWQDYPLQWGYTADPAFHQEALKQAKDMVNRFFNYPSIIVWSMHNETPHAMNWMQKRDPKQNLALDDDLVKLVGDLDRSRVAHRDSGTGDGHVYPGWYEGKVGDYSTMKGAPFLTEYGAEAIPNMETLQTIFDPAFLFPTTDEHWQAWKYANFQPEQTFKLAGVQQGKTTQEFIENSQRYQANLIRFSTEIFRRNKWTGSIGSTGLYHFMFVEDWPSITWAVVDYYRRPKLGFEALKSSMQPVLPSIAYQIDDPDKPIALYVVNDVLQEFPGAQAKWRVVGGENSAAESRAVTLNADSVTKITELGAMPGVTRGGGRLEFWVEDRDGKVLGRSSLSANDFVAKKAERAASN
jgi:beta-mannosidase